jgi:hypothetical protein
MSEMFTLRSDSRWAGCLPAFLGLGLMTPGCSIPAGPEDTAQSGGEISIKLVGNSQSGGSGDSSDPGTAEAFQYTASGSGTLDQLSVYLDATNAASTVGLALYGNMGSSPGLLLTSGTLASPAPGAWNSASVPSVAVTAGTVYWIAILSPAGGPTPAFDDTNTGIGRASVSSSQTNLTGFTKTWSSGSVWPNWTMMAYGSGVGGTIPAPVPVSPSNDAGRSANARDGAAALDSGTESAEVGARGGGEGGTAADADARARGEAGTGDAGEAGARDSGGAGSGSGTGTGTGTGKEGGTSAGGDGGTTGPGGAVCGSASDGTGAVLFCEDFNEAGLDTSQWVPMNREGDPTSGEREYLLPGNVSVSNGLLTISSQPAKPAIQLGADQPPGGFEFSSGLVQWKSFSFTYGTIQYRAKMAGGVATWPAIWLLGADCQQTNLVTANNVGTCNWPAPGSDEIDMTEILVQGGAINQQIHVGPGDNQSTENDGCTNVFPPTGDPESEFHDYEVDWEPGTVVWKVDGKTTCSVAKSYVPSHPMFLIINTAIFPSAVLSSSWPQSTEVDYVKVTQ